MWMEAVTRLMTGGVLEGRRRRTVVEGGGEGTVAGGKPETCTHSSASCQLLEFLPLRQGVFHGGVKGVQSHPQQLCRVIFRG